MGVKTKSNCNGDAPVELYCEHCEEAFWTDETMVNTCPVCGFQSMTTADNRTQDKPAQ